MTIDELKEYILEHTNGIFSGFCYKTDYEFKESGVSDKLVNLFYIRPLTTGQNKYSVTRRDHMVFIKNKNRLVVQVNRKCSNVDNTFLNILLSVSDVINLTSYSDDTLGVYKAEYGEGAPIRDFNLLMFDFEFTREEAYDHICECINETGC